MSKELCELVQHVDEIQNLVKANEKIQVQNEEMRKEKNLEESVQGMEQRTGDSHRMKLIMHHPDTIVNEIYKESGRYQLQV